MSEGIHRPLGCIELAHFQFLEFLQGFGLGVHIELHINVLDVEIHGTRGNAEPIRDHFLGKALGEQFNDLVFLFGKGIKEF